MSAPQKAHLAATFAGGLALAFVSAQPFAQEMDRVESRRVWQAQAEAPRSDAGTNTDQDTKHDQATAATTDPVSPSAPEHTMQPMDARSMLETMEMNDNAATAMVKLDRLERAFDGDGPAFAWDADAWIGRDFDKLRLRSEGERTAGALEHADVEALWSHALAPYWDSEIGMRRDFGAGPDRSWAAFGVQGLAPYWLEIAATAYAGQGGHTAVRVEGEYELSLTQRWILQPRVEVNAYGQGDPATGRGAGLSDAAIGLRFRYEIRREFAPYIGIEWSRRLAGTLTLRRDEGLDTNDTRLVAGLRIWY